MVKYPRQFAFLQPLASKCDLVGNDNDCATFVGGLTSTERQQFVDMYAMLVRRGEKVRLDKWIEQGVSDDRSEVFRLLVLLDYMARHAMVPKEIAKTRFIEWDTRRFDDKGNEW